MGCPMPMRKVYSILLQKSMNIIRDKKKTPLMLLISQRETRRDGYKAAKQSGASGNRMSYVPGNVKENQKTATMCSQKARVPMPKNPATNNGDYIRSLTDARLPVKWKFADIKESGACIRNISVDFLRKPLYNTTRGIDC